MRLKWGKEKVCRISKEVPTAERYNELGWWVCWVTLGIMIVMFIIKVKG